MYSLTHFCHLYDLMWPFMTLTVWHYRSQYSEPGIQWNLSYKTQHFQTNQFITSPRNWFLFLYKTEPLMRDHPSFKTTPRPHQAVLKERFDCIWVVSSEIKFNLSWLHIKCSNWYRQIILGIILETMNIKHAYNNIHVTLRGVLKGFSYSRRWYFFILLFNKIYSLLYYLLYSLLTYTENGKKPSFIHIAER